MSAPLGNLVGRVHNATLRSNFQSEIVGFANRNHTLQPHSNSVTKKNIELEGYISASVSN
jgi:hypothetical protein